MAGKKKSAPLPAFNLNKMSDEHGLQAWEGKAIDVFTSLHTKTANPALANITMDSLVDLTVEGKLGEISKMLTALRGTEVTVNGIDKGKDLIWELNMAAFTAPLGSQSTYSCHKETNACLKEPISDNETFVALSPLSLPKLPIKNTLNQNRGIPIYPQTAAIIGYLNVFSNQHHAPEMDIDDNAFKAAARDLIGEKNLSGITMTQSSLVADTQADFNTCLQEKGGLKGCAKTGNHFGILVRSNYEDARYNGSIFIGPATPTVGKEHKR